MSQLLQHWKPTLQTLIAVIRKTRHCKENLFCCRTKTPHQAHPELENSETKTVGHCTDTDTVTNIYMKVH